MNIIDTIAAEQIEDGDQILVFGDPLENVRVEGDPDDLYSVLVTGFSNNTGDTQSYSLNYTDIVEVWAV